MKLPMRILKSEAGQVLPMALILLVLGGMLVVPVLSLMSTNLTFNRVVKTGNLELYAADAGLENMLWNIQYDLYDEVNNPDGFKLPTDTYQPPPLEFTLNERTVNVQISKESVSLYKVISTGTSANGHSTTVQSFINVQADYSWFFDSAITSASNVSISPNSVVNGDVTYSGDNPDIKGTVTDIDNDGQTVTQEPGLGDKWPTAEELIEVYSAQVANAPTVPAGYSIDVSGYTAAAPRSIWNGGPLRALGDLEIKGSGYARLDGTLYVDNGGNLTVKPGCTIDLNGQTIFVEGWIDFQPGCAIIGSGCVIAVGDIKFSPNIGADIDDKLIGVADDVAGTASQNGSKFILARFQANKTGKLEIFRMYCWGSDGYVKVALYADSGGETPTPTTRMSAANQSQQQVVTKNQWNNISFWRNEAQEVSAGTDYWLAANASSNSIITYKAEPSKSVMRAEAFDFFSFPDPAGTGFTGATDKQYLFAGYKAPFVFLLSVAGNSTIQPGGTLYGCVAGGSTTIQTSVEMQGKTVLTLSNTPSDGLNFPGWNQGSDNSTGIPPRIRTYTINPD